MEPHTPCETAMGRRVIPMMLMLLIGWLPGVLSQGDATLQVKLYIYIYFHSPVFSINKIWYFFSFSIHVQAGTSGNEVVEEVVDRVVAR